MELLDVLRRLKIAAMAFIGVLIMGVLGFGYISDGQWFDAFYMTAITISTIGFHEVIDLSEHPGGRAFTVFLAFSGIGVLTYLLSNLSALFIEGDIRKTFVKRSIMKKVRQMEGHYIICGCGRVGRNIAMELLQTGRPFVLVDVAESAVERFLHEYPRTLFLVGDCTDERFLESIGADRARGIFATASDDNTNLVICLTARQLNPNARIVSRVRDTTHILKMKRAGADSVISPNYIGGLRMASEMIRPEVTSFLDEMNSSQNNLRIEEIMIPIGFEAKSLEDLSIQRFSNTLLLAVKQLAKWHYNPEKSLSIQAGDKLIVMTTPEDRASLENQITKNLA